MAVKPSWHARFVAIAAMSLWALHGQAATLDTAALLADLRTLASPAFAGRATGSEGNRLAQEYIQQRFKEIGVTPFGNSYAMPFAFTQTSKAGKITPFPSAVNLIGYLRGSDHPDRYMVVSAHFDHVGVRDGLVYLGADDNASGVAAMLAIAARFKAQPPKNTIVFAAFDAEDSGRNGAAYFVKSAPFPIARVALNLNLDMVSRSDKNEIFAAGTRYTPALKAFVAQAAATSSVKVILGHDSQLPGAPPDDDWTAQSDHHAFYQLQIPFLYFGVEDHADAHMPGDTFEKIDPAFFSDVVRMLVTTAGILDQNLEAIK